VAHCRGILFVCFCCVCLLDGVVIAAQFGVIVVSWVYLVIAIGLEVSGTTCMKLSDSLTRLVPTIAMFVLYFISFTFLALALKDIDVSIAYAIWSGVGIVLITVIDIYVFKSYLGPWKLFAIALILIGAIMLKMLH